MIDPEESVIEVLDGLGLPYEQLDCNPAFADTANFCAHYGYPPENSGNTILVASKKEPKKYAACVVRSSRRLDVNKKVRELLGGVKLSFASAEETKAVTGMLIGGVTPFALPDSLPVFIDEGIMALDYVLLGGGGRSSKIKISPQVFERIPNVRIIPDLAIEKSS